ncbi:unnamed protein product [Orchesella dallaii]|uniref:DUF4806 domain-containing protein n=1 Tax=Orchesella dallaii TaxID=48710 RepID=A0ABP1S8M8_9HEXA
MFSIVEFVETREVAVVCVNWIMDGNLCAWPPFKRSESIISAVKKQLFPLKSWGQYPIRIMKEYGTYSEAAANLGRAEMTSDLSEAEATFIRRRSNVVSRVTSDGESSESDVVPMKLHTPKKRKKASNVSRLSLPIPPILKPNRIEPHFSAESSCSTLPSPSRVRLVLNNYDDKDKDLSTTQVRTPTQDLYPSNTYSVPAIRSPPGVDPSVGFVEQASPQVNIISSADNKFRQYVVRSLQSIKTTLQQLAEAVTALTMQSTNHTESLQAATFFNVPVSSYVEFCQLCDQLKDNSAEMDKLTTILAGVGGSDYKDATRKVLRRIMRDEVALLFSMLGRKQKRNFSTTVVRDVVIGAVRQSIKPKPTESEVETVIAEWLKHAKKRIPRVIVQNNVDNHDCA